jgi:hypothetical protein
MYNHTKLTKIIEVSFGLSQTQFTIGIEQYSQDVYMMQCDVDYPNPDGIEFKYVDVEVIRGCSFEFALAKWIYNTIVDEKYNTDVNSNAFQKTFEKFMNEANNCKQFDFIGHDSIETLWNRVEKKEVKSQNNTSCTLGDTESYKIMVEKYKMLNEC